MVIQTLCAYGGLAGMMICNDRRWPESYRVLGLQGVDMIAGSCIVAPTGEIVERCDLELGRSYRQTTFNFALHRRIEHYRMIVERTGPTAPGG